MSTKKVRHIKIWFDFGAMAESFKKSVKLLSQRAPFCQRKLTAMQLKNIKHVKNNFELYT